MLVGPGQVASTATAQLCASIENTGVNVVGGGSGLLPEGAVAVDVSGNALAGTQDGEGVGVVAGGLESVTDGWGRGLGWRGFSLRRVVAECAWVLVPVARWRRLAAGRG